LYCLSFPLGHCIVCLFLLGIVLSVFSSWALYCLSFPLRGKDIQYNDKEEKTKNAMTKRKRQTIQWPRGKDIQYNDHEEKTDNTMTKRRRQAIQCFSSWSLYCLSFPLGHCIVCRFFLVIVLSVFFSWSLYCLWKRQTIQWPRGKDRQHKAQEETTDNTMTKKKRQTIQWPRGKDRQCNDQDEKTYNTMTNRKRQTIQWPRGFPLGHCIVCLFLLGIVLSVFSSWALYCLSFPLGHCIVYLFLLVIVLSVFSSWSLYCLSYPLERHTIQWPRGKDRQYNVQGEKTDNTKTKRKRQTMPWPKVKNRQYNDQK
jgi:amino acid transporter